jgi:hypothetical protein
MALFAPLAENSAEIRFNCEELVVESEGFERILSHTRRSRHLRSWQLKTFVNELKRRSDDLAIPI